MNRHNGKILKKRKSSKRGKHFSSAFRRFSAYLFWALLSVVSLVFLFFIVRTVIIPRFPLWNKAIHSRVQYPDGTVRGIDISHYQSDIDWERLRNARIHGAPISFIYVKATEGTDIIDENFNQNFFNAKKNNILRGAYHFYSPQSSAAAQARFFCKIVQLEESDLPPVLDVEKIGDLTPQQLCKELKTWLSIVEDHYHVRPILYASYKFRQKYLQTLEFDENPYWIAHYYVDSLSYKGDWHFWQHTDAGRVDGIKGYVDINVFNGSFEQLMLLTIQQESLNTEPL